MAVHVAERPSDFLRPPPIESGLPPYMGLQDDKAAGVSASMEETAKRIDSAALDISSVQHRRGAAPADSIKGELQGLVEDGLEKSQHLDRDGQREETLGRLWDDANAMANKVTEFLEACKSKSKKAASAASSSTPYYTLVHELRVPLQNLFYLLDLPVGERPPSFFQDLKDSYNLLSQLLDDIPDDPNQESEILLRLAPFSLNQLRDRVRSQISQYAKRFGVKINFPPDLDHHLIGDKHRIGQLLRNFISNAIKHSKSPVIDLVFEIEAENVVFKVIDQGKGISAKDQKKLFLPFSQVDDCCSCLPWRRPKAPSSGIGLFFCKRVAELMNEGQEGVIGVRSEGKKRGSEFWFRIPYREAPKEVPIPATPVREPPALFDLEGLAILAADDTPLTLRMYAGWLKSGAARYDEATDGHLAVQAVQDAAREGIYYDIIILDMHMPTLNGVPAAKRIREIVKERSPYYFFVSGDPRDEIERELGPSWDRRKIVILGKPIQRKAFAMEIDRVQALRRSSQS